MADSNVVDRMRQEWNERYGSYVQAARAWRIVGVTGMTMAVIGFSYALYQSTQVKLVPYIVEVDKLGAAAIAGYPQQIEYADPRVVRAALGSFITTFRSITPDAVVQKQYIDRTYALLGVFVAGLVAVFLYGFFGSLSDRIGRKTTYMIGAVAMAVSVIPAIALINTGNPWLFALALVLVFGVAMAPAGGATGSLFALMFGAEVRYTGVSVGYTLSQICGSAFAPLIAVALYGATGSTNGLVIYLLAASAVTIVSLLILPGPWGRKEAAKQLEYAATKTDVAADAPAHS